MMNVAIINFLYLQMHPQDMNTEQLSDVKKKIISHFTTGPGAPLGITSIFFKAYGQK